MCCGGYTEFCCTITGRNTCPPGTLLGGWWKVDGSGFCNGPRYYMDCNAPCGPCGCGGSGICSGSCSGTGCGCANGDCNNRKAGCVQFRYGQCNQNVPCLGPILCRVVTCIPPWEIDATCSTTARIDEGTRYHDRPCLHGVVGSLESVTVVPGGVRVSGWALDADTSDPIDVEVLVGGSVVATVYASGLRGDIAQAFPGHGPRHGFDATVAASGGRREVCVRAVHRGPDAGSRTTLGCRTVVLSGSAEGNLEVVGPAGPGKVRVAGWAHDPDTTGPVDVHVYVDGVGRANVRADRPRPDVAAALGIGPNHGFDLVLDVGGGTHEVCVHAINVGAGDNRLLGCRQVDAGNHLGVLESLRAQPGAIRVAGWVLDVDTTAPVDVHVYVDGRGAANVPADRPRPDVAAAVPGAGPATGFDLTLPVAAGDHRVAVFAINEAGGGSTTLMAERTVVVGGDPIGVVEAVQARPGALRVTGWAVDPDTPAAIDVHVYVDGVGRANVVADVPRPDVARAVPGAGAGHGFDVTVPVPAGAHQVCVYAINVGTGRTSPLLGCRSVVTGGSPVGRIDDVRQVPGGLRVTGWALDPDTADPVDVHLYVDGVGRANVVASVARPDIAQAFRGWGEAHGFDATIPLAPGGHEVCAFAINAGAGATTSLGCRQATSA